MASLQVQGSAQKECMETVYDLPGLRKIISDWKKDGLSIALVPTMGNLHAGHLSLLERAREIADKTVVSIFVNPIQFGKGEDYEQYPSTFENDRKVLSDNSLNLLFAPDLEQLYPGGLDVDTRVTVPGLSNILCGKFRPDHFSGVATVVTKLLINVQPDVALFGEKDYQQLLVIKRLVSDLCLPVDIVGMPIVREPNGLAMSSRNAYLSNAEHEKAALIYQSLRQAVDQLRKGNTDIKTIESEGLNSLESADFKPEYFSVRRSVDLGLPLPGDTRLSILAAAWLGYARLIDNIKIILNNPIDK